MQIQNQNSKFCLIENSLKDFKIFYFIVEKLENSLSLKILFFAIEKLHQLFKPKNLPFPEKIRKTGVKVINKGERGER